MLSSEQALNSILHRVESIAQQYEADREKAQQAPKTDDMIVSLLMGMQTTSENGSGRDAGVQLKDLAMGIGALTNIDKKEIKDTTKIIYDLGKSLSSIEQLMDDTNTSIDTTNITNMLTALSSAFENMNATALKDSAKSYMIWVSH